MGIILLLTLLFIICVVLLVIYAKVYNYYSDLWEVIGFLSIVIGSVLLIALFITSIACIVNNTNYTKRKVRIEYNETVESLNNTKEYVETITDDYARSIAVTEYNNEVKAFKSDIMKEKNRLNNGWINWFTCSEYKKLDTDAIEYIKIFKEEK